MKIEEIYEEWEKDGAIDASNVSGESVKTPKLHNKYFRYYVEEGLRLKSLRAEYKKLYKLKSDYFRGDLDKEELKELGWPVQQLKILRTDIPSYVESDSDIINMTLKIGMAEAKVEYLESIIRQINNRGYQLKNIVDWERFKSGG